MKQYLIGSHDSSTTCIQGQFGPTSIDGAVALLYDRYVGGGAFGQPDDLPWSGPPRAYEADALADALIGNGDGDDDGDDEKQKITITVEDIPASRDVKPPDGFWISQWYELTRDDAWARWAVDLDEPFDASRVRATRGYRAWGHEGVITGYHYLLRDGDRAEFEVESGDGSYFDIEEAVVKLFHGSDEIDLWDECATREIDLDDSPESPSCDPDREWTNAPTAKRKKAVQQALRRMLLDIDAEQKSNRE